MAIHEKLEAFDDVVSQLRDILERKNHDYGDHNINVLGERGCFVRIWDKVSRLKQLMWDNKDAKVKEESIDDSLRDLANYAIITLILRKGKWI